MEDNLLGRHTSKSQKRKILIAICVVGLLGAFLFAVWPRSQTP